MHLAYFREVSKCVIEQRKPDPFRLENPGKTGLMISGELAARSGLLDVFTEIRFAFFRKGDAAFLRFI